MKIAAVQFTSGDEVADNLRTAQRMIAAAACAGQGRGAAPLGADLDPGGGGGAGAAQSGAACEFDAVQFVHDHIRDAQGHLRLRHRAGTGVIGPPWQEADHQQGQEQGAKRAHGPDPCRRRAGLSIGLSRM